VPFDIGQWCHGSGSSADITSEVCRYVSQRYVHGPFGSRILIKLMWLGADPDTLVETDPDTLIGHWHARKCDRVKPEGIRGDASGVSDSPLRIGDMP